MTPAHLLPLGTLHDAAPGVLDVVFGPDGDFDGAPMWRGPIAGEVYRTRGHWTLHFLTDRGAVLYRDASGYAVPHADAALDLRIPSVQHRLSALCALALGIDGDTPSALTWRTGRRRFLSGWLLQRPLGRDQWRPRVAAWDADGIALPPDGTRAIRPPDVPVDPMAVREPHEFLGRLTLALAPQIATLGGGR